jgi:hypothetical protein
MMFVLPAFIASEGVLYRLVGCKVNGMRRPCAELSSVLGCCAAATAGVPTCAEHHT